MTLFRDLDSCGGVRIHVGGPKQYRELSEEEIAYIIDALEHKKMFIEQFDRLAEANKLLIMETNDLRKQLAEMTKKVQEIESNGNSVAVQSDRWDVVQKV
jgi:hypothetical protein